MSMTVAGFNKRYKPNDVVLVDGVPQKVRSDATTFGPAGPTQQHVVLVTGHSGYVNLSRITPALGDLTASPRNG